MFVVAVCCCLLAVVAGQGVIITPFLGCTNCAVNSVVFPSSSIYLLLTMDSKVWRSTDEGQTWTNVLSGINYFEQSAADPLSVVFIPNSGVSFYTTSNGGQDIITSNPPISYLSGITLHPTQPWILVYSCSSTCNTYYSKNFGGSWMKGPSGIGVNYIVWSNYNASADTIFALQSDRSFGYTNNYGSSWTTLKQSSIGYVVTNNYLYVGVIAGSSSANLYSSSNRHDPAHTNPQYYWLDEFPNGNSLPETGYTFLDDSTRSEFIGVAQSQSQYWGNVFSSDFDGDQFALTLNYVAQTNLLYDFDKFNGLSGIFVANAYPSATSPASAKQTVISFDNGGEWKKLIAPATNSLGIPTNCSLTTGCSLHLHGLTSWYTGLFPPFYSSPNSIGLMVAVGNLGLLLTSDTSSLKTYFSRDAGITWSELFPQPTIYEFGDHGGILVYAVITTPTTSVYYSLNEGLTSQSYTFTTTAIYVDNIIIEPQGTGMKFVLLGHSGSGPTIKYYIYGLDFTGLNLPQCTDSDYENWSPSNDDKVNSNCFMGSVTVYKRRKQTSQCYTPPGTDHIISSTPCPCAWEDYECDVGFSPSARNATDYFSCTPTLSVPYCATGYRLIPDTSCEIVSGIDLQSKNCPGYSGTPTTISTSSSSSTGQPAGTTGGDSTGGDHTGAIVAVVIIFMVLFGGVAAVGFLYYKNETFRDWVLSKFSSTPSQGYGRVNTEENEEAAPAI
jgi:hypothetical protein